MCTNLTSNYVVENVIINSTKIYTQRTIYSHYRCINPNLYPFITVSIEEFPAEMSCDINMELFTPIQVKYVE